MANRKRRAIIAATTLLGACGEPIPPSTPPAAITPPVIAPATPEPLELALRAVERDVLPHDGYARRVVYTWTTAEQIAELRAGNPLLVRDTSPTRGASYIDQVLFALADAGDPLAALLYTTPYAKARFAWHAPWATLDGWSDETYGDQLIAVTLRPEAIVVALSSARGIVGARDLANRPIALDTVAASPERIAAVYFTSEGESPPAADVPQPLATYREVMLCNESMIESWEVGTEELQREIDAEIATLEALAAYLRGKPPRARPTIEDARGPVERIPERMYGAALAFFNERYLLTTELLRARVDRLRALPHPVPFHGLATAAFPGRGELRPPPRTWKGSSTHGTFMSAPSKKKPPR